MADEHTGGDSARTVIVAVLANLAIAVAKFVAAAITGSSSPMPSPRRHSMSRLPGAKISVSTPRDQMPTS